MNKDIREDNDFTADTPFNWQNELQQTIDGYDSPPAKGLVHGLQKDAIQNGWGHRISYKGQNWQFTFELVTKNGVSFLALTDEGTTGLTGPNLSTEEIDDVMESLPETHKLARFTGMKFSGGDSNAAGLYGRGKMLFHAVSKTKHIIFESLTKDEGYRLNTRKLIGLKLKHYRHKALENKDGIEALSKLTGGLEPLKKIGTRILIEDPIDEVVESIKSGQFLKYIEETWWRIIHKGAKISVKYDGKEMFGSLPKDYGDLPKENKDGWEVWYISRPIKMRDNYVIKNLHLLKTPNEIAEDLRGIHLYRKGMKVGGFRLNVPVKIEKKYFGYVELDKNSEQEVAKVEDLEHYGWKSKHLNAYKLLDYEVKKEHDNFMDHLGLLKKPEHEEARLKKKLEEIAAELNTMFADMGLDNIGEGVRRNKSFEVLWKGVLFPKKDSSVVETDDVIKKIKFLIKNNTGQKKKFHIDLSVYHNKIKLMELYNNENEVGPSGEELFGPFEIPIQSPPLERYSKMNIKLSVSDKSSTKYIVKNMPFYYETEPEKRPDFGFSIMPVNMDFPKKGSKRIDTDEYLRNITYRIKNNTSYEGDLGIHIRTHNMENADHPVIETLLKQHEIVKIQPYSEVDIKCPDIHFSQDKYLPHLDKGIIELRAGLIASAAFGKFEFADEVSKTLKSIIYFNRDEEGVNIFKEVRTIKEEGGARSDADIIQGNWIFSINEAHPCFHNFMDDEEKFDNYIAEEMIKQSLLVYLHNDKYEGVFLENKEWFEDDNRTSGEVYKEFHKSYDKMLAYRYGGK